MQKQRYRKTEFPSNEDASQGVLNWDGANWANYEPNADIYHNVQTAHWESSEMRDVINDSQSRRFHDVTHRKVINSHFWNEANGIILSPQQTFCTDKTPLSKLVTVPLNALYKYTPQVGMELPVWYVESLFRRPELPVFIDVDKDPVDTGFSLWFLLVDIAQVPKLLQSITSFVRTLTYHQRQNTAQELASLNLAQSFGVVPFIKDVKDLMRILRTWQTAYDKLRAQVDQVYTWHSKPFILDPSDDSYLPPRVLSTGPISGLHTLTNLSGEIHRGGLRVTHRRTMQYRLTCPEVTSFLSRCKQLVDSLGLLDPAALWDVIPFSFIADWYAPIGTWLHRNRPRLLKLDMLVLDYTESVKVERQSRFMYRGLYPPEGEGPETAIRGLRPGSLVSEVVYLRRRMKPPIQAISPPTLKSFGSAIAWGRAKIALSLIAQKFPRQGSLRGPRIP